jgi:hypothetical protein
VLDAAAQRRDFSPFLIKKLKKGSVGLSKPRPKRLVYLRKGFEKVYLRV